MFLSFRIPAFAFVLALLLQANTPQHETESTETSPSQHAMGTHLKVKGISNLGQVSETLYRGALPSPVGFEALKKMGIEVVIDMRRGHDQAEEDTVTKLGMKYVSIPSRCPFPQDEPIARFLKVMRENHGRRVFVHCRLGDDRTGLAVASYRIAEQGWTASEAKTEMRSFGFNSFHDLICPGLQNYEETFPQRLKNNPAFRDLTFQSGSAAK